MIHDLLNDDDRLRFLVDYEVLEKAGSEPFESLAGYMDAFAAFHGLGGSDVAELYVRFLDRHVTNLNRFARTRKYPFELDGAVEDVPRVEYELALILSTLTTRHRHRVMELLHSGAGLDGPRPPTSAVIIGVGPGLEIGLLVDRFATLRGYDPNLSEFCSRHHAGASLVKGLFDGTQEQDQPRVYYLIEVLEHLPQPYNLVDLIRESAAPGSLLVLTTIRDEPQFDHVYNFRPGELGEYARSHGLAIRFHERITHKAIGDRSPGENEFYVLELTGP
jgi:hypothetical protein